MSPSELVGDFDAVVNILLFITFGFGLGLLPRIRRNLLIMAGAFLLTLFIELTQMLVPDLGRGCESADMIDNTLGLAIGLTAGITTSLIVSRYHVSRDADPV